jgi:hypothetical protein
VNIFVSSTYRDLAEHREVIRIALQMSGYSFCGMEHFSSNQLPPLDVCLQTLESCDVYVGIIGGLYGSSPPRRKLSYTELEYNYSRSLGIYHIILVISDNAQISISHVERDPNRITRLERFRARVINKHTVQDFTDANEAAWKILAALRNYEVRLREQQPMEV